MNFNNVCHLTQQIWSIVIATWNQHKISSMSYFTFFYHTKPLKTSVYFILYSQQAHPNSATVQVLSGACGLCPPSQTAQLWALNFSRGFHVPRLVCLTSDLAYCSLTGQHPFTWKWPRPHRGSQSSRWWEGKSGRRQMPFHLSSVLAAGGLRAESRRCLSHLPAAACPGGWLTARPQPVPLAAHPRSSTRPSPPVWAEQKREEGRRLLLQMGLDAAAQRA